MSKNDGGPAFPCPDEISGPCGDGSYVITGTDGMSLRDYFAAKAMQGLVANPAVDEHIIGMGFRESKEMLAEFAYATADAMLAEREKQ